MPSIKTKSKNKIKELDNTLKLKNKDIKKIDRNKRNITSLSKRLLKNQNKEKATNTDKNENNEENYATEKIENGINKFSNKAILTFNKKGYESTRNIIEEIYLEQKKSGKIYEKIKQVQNQNEKIEQKNTYKNDKVNGRKPNEECLQETKIETNKVNENVVFNKSRVEKNQNVKIANDNNIKPITYNYDNNRFMNTKTKIVNTNNKSVEQSNDNKNIKTKSKVRIKTKEESLKINNTIKSKENTYDIKGNNRTDKIKMSNNVEKRNNKVVQTQNNINKFKKKVEETIEKTKKSINNIRKVLKAIAIGTEKMMEFLIAGGWIVMVIIIVISLIAFITTSIFGIFISDKVDTNSVTIKSVMRDLNNEFIIKLTNIQNDVSHDEFDIKGERAKWKDIIAVFIVKYSDGNYQTELLTLDDKKVSEFKKAFWEMNEITYSTEEIEKEIEVTDDKGKTKKEKIKSKVLHIVINGKSISDMKLSKKQLEMIGEILKDDYTQLWNELLYGSSNGSTDIVEIARSQLGQVGGSPYWSWYGFNSRVEWCACFVSWCANECGYIEKGIIPKFAGCESEGVKWFQTCNLWQDNSYIPNSGDIIFFDWESDGHSDHVGIVEKVENGLVYTIEGNSSDSCRERNYTIGNWQIKGYGTPQY